MKSVAAVLMILLLSACATPYQQRTATQGAVLGAAAGAVIGAQSDNAEQGAVIGGALGALAGAVIAENREKSVYASAPRYHRRACRRGAQYFNRARRVRNLDRKIDLIEKGLRYCPNNPAAHNDLGVALELAGDYAAARVHFERALRIDPDYLPARRNLQRMHRHHSRRYERRTRSYGRDYGDGYEHEQDRREYGEDD